MEKWLCEKEFRSQHLLKEQDVAMHSCNPRAVVQRQEDCCDLLVTSLALGSERPCFKGISQRMIEQETWHPPLASTKVHTYTSENKYIKW